MGGQHPSATRSRLSPGPRQVHALLLFKVRQAGPDAVVGVRAEAQAARTMRHSRLRPNKALPRIRIAFYAFIGVTQCL